MACKDPDGFGASDFQDDGSEGTDFPFPPPVPVERYVNRRDWFAGMALMGLNASDSANFGYDSVEATVDAARRYADAMIAELDKE